VPNAKLGAEWFAYSFLVGFLHSLLHAGCSENIIRWEEDLPKNHILAPLCQAVSDIAGGDVSSWILGYDTRNDTKTFIAENHSLWERDLGKRLNLVK
jgi:hypothetical protein